MRATSSEWPAQRTSTWKPTSMANSPAPCSKPRSSISRSNKCMSGLLGLLVMASASIGSASNTIEQAGSITICKNSMCTGIRSMGQPSSTGRMDRPTMGTCTATMKTMALRRLANRRRPCCTASSSEEKSSLSKTSAAASRATSVPRAPMATPMLAAFNAGASLTPSPVMATISPRLRKACTRRNFCSGAMRQKTSVSARRARSAVSSSAARSMPDITALATPAIPACRAIASAVAGWSPVIITTRMPAA